MNAGSRRTVVALAAAVSSLGFGLRPEPATAGLAGLVNRTSVSRSPRLGALNPGTDIAVGISSPGVLAKGTSFHATLSVANLGTSPAKWVTCGVATPRADAVSNFAITVVTRTTLDGVEGNESKQFSIPVMKPREVRRITLYGITVVGTARTEFDLSVFCIPSYADANQTNNAALRTVTLWPASV